MYVVAILHLQTRNCISAARCSNCRAQSIHLDKSHVIPHYFYWENM